MKKLKRLKKGLIAITTIIGVYILVMFFNIPFISKWRDIYIETAMTTADHQWLATYFIPKSVIDKVMVKQVNNMDMIAITYIRNERFDDEDIIKVIPKRGVEEYFKKDKDILNQRHLQVGDKDIAGNEIVVNDIEQGIIISEVVGNTYKGKLVMIDDPSRVFVGVTDKKGDRGKLILDFLDSYDSVVGINANGFNDPNGSGMGGEVIGLTYSQGTPWGVLFPSYGTVAFDNYNRLIVGNIADWEAYSIRDGGQFIPSLIANGESLIDGSGGWGLQPRTIVGQRADGTVIFLVIDGRQPGHSLGATMGDCADLLLEYGVVTAGALDGGSSSILAYDGKIMTKCSSPSKVGRYLPNAFLVKRKVVDEMIE